MALLSTAHRCPVITRQISVSSIIHPVDHHGTSPAKPKADQRRLFAHTPPQVDVSATNGCPFVPSCIGMVRASPEVQEDIQEGKFNQTIESKIIGKSVSGVDGKYLLIHRFDRFYT